LSVLSTPQQRWFVNPSLARVVAGDASNGLVLIVPGSGHVCIVSVGFSDGSVAGCGSAAAFESEGTVTTGKGLSGYLIRGVLPDGASNVQVTLSDGTTVRPEVNSMGGFVLTTQTEPQTASFVARDGHQHTLALSATPALS
jgi:hypothetical protein